MANGTNGTVVKIVGGLLTALLLLLLGIALNRSHEANAGVQKVKVEQAGMKKDVEYIKEDISEIKSGQAAMRVEQRVILDEIRRIPK